MWEIMWIIFIFIGFYHFDRHLSLILYLFINFLGSSIFQINLYFGLYFRGVYFDRRSFLKIISGFTILDFFL